MEQTRPSTVPSAAAKPLRVGVVGLGFMGSTHVAAYRSAQAAGLPVKLVAVADPDPGRRAGKLQAAGNLESGQGTAFDPDAVAGYASLEELLEHADVDLISLCTHTDTHVPMAVRAVEAGRHVLVEKPVATRLADVQDLAEAVIRSGCMVFPAMCMRHWPGWTELLAATRDGRYGKPTSLTFHRLASPPDWSPAFYRDASRTGGALFDLHVHDADIIYALLGLPRAVTSAGHPGHVTTIYHYDHGPSHVVAEGGFDHAPGFAFTMRYVANFEQATMRFDLAGGKSPLTIHTAAGTQTPAAAPLTGYEAEIRAVVQALVEGADAGMGIGDALAVTRLLEAEARSLATGRTIELADGKED